MSTDLVPVAEHITKKGHELELTAENGMQMGICMDEMIEWADYRVNLMQEEHDEVELQYLHAKKHKWRTSGFKQQMNLRLKRKAYYQKIKVAIEAGYCPMPNLPGVTIFGIRTDRKNPKHMTHIVRWSNEWHVTQKAGKLPVGEGEYVDPDPEFTRDEFTKTDSNGKKETQYEISATKWKDIDFPMQMAKPNIMEATSRAMALKAFDEMGILPAGNPSSTTARGDPLILGHILDPRSTTYHDKKITFIIGWRLDTANI